jgi:hypothetical protein
MKNTDPLELSFFSNFQSACHDATGQASPKGLSNQAVPIRMVLNAKVVEPLYDCLTEGGRV